MKKPEDDSLLANIDRYIAGLDRFKSAIDEAFEARKRKAANMKLVQGDGSNVSVCNFNGGELPR